MLYQFIDELGDVDMIDQGIATSIYTGILTDTGAFKFNSTSSTTHRIVADLMDKGADNFKIASKVFDDRSIDKLKLQGIALNNLTLVENNKAAAYISLSKEELKACNYQKGDSEGLVNLALSVKGVNLAAIFIEDPAYDFIKISLRSKGEFSVNELSRNHFNGGGHNNAAGGRLESSLDEAIGVFKKLSLEYKEQILNSYE
jgi:phosphoesterase RecJ-like protein